MTFEPSKFFQNIELRLRGRTAIVVTGTLLMLGGVWLMLRDYPLHPMLSNITVGGLFVCMVIFLGLGLLGKARPDEVSDKSFVHVDQLGIYVAQGISSQKDLVELMKQLSGMKRIPAPSHRIHGSAANPRNYVPLTSEQSNSVVAGIESGIRQLLEGVVKQTLPIDKSHQPAGIVHEGPSVSTPIQGKTSMPQIKDEGR